jgi:hypothetical protein
MRAPRKRWLLCSAEITRIDPSAGPPGAEVTLSGPDLWTIRLIPDATDLTDWLGPVLFGPFQAVFDAQGGESVFWRQNYRWWFQVQTPAPALANTSAAGAASESALQGLLGVASGVDVDLRFQGQYHTGAKALISPELNLMAEDGSRCGVCLLSWSVHCRVARIDLGDELHSRVSNNVDQSRRDANAST